MKMFNPPHPGRILGACFGGGRSIESTAAKIGIPVTDLTAVIDGKAPITPELAELLHTVLTSTPPRIWLKLQERYDAWQTEHGPNPTSQKEPQNENI